MTSSASSQVTDNLHRISLEYIEKVKDVRLIVSFACYILTSEVVLNKTLVQHVKEQENRWRSDLTSIRQEVSRLTICVNHHEDLKNQLKNRLMQSNRKIAVQRAHKVLRIQQIIRQWKSVAGAGEDRTVILNLCRRIDCLQVSARSEAKVINGCACFQNST